LEAIQIFKPTFKRFMKIRSVLNVVYASTQLSNMQT
jgi:hypothetical protein